MVWKLCRFALLIGLPSTLSLFIIYCNFIPWFLCRACIHPNMPNEVIHSSHADLKKVESGAALPSYAAPVERWERVCRAIYKSSCGTTDYIYDIFLNVMHLISKLYQTTLSNVWNGWEGPDASTEVWMCSFYSPNVSCVNFIILPHWPCCSSWTCHHKNLCWNQAEGRQCCGQWPDQYPISGVLSTADSIFLFTLSS